jgi:hypothetical protein
VGVFRQGAAETASVWRPGSCRETLLPLFDGGGSSASAINADATIVGGSAPPACRRRVSFPFAGRIRQACGRSSNSTAARGKPSPPTPSATSRGL